MGETFDWNYPGLNWSHFHSLANLLSLRNGGQVEPASLSIKLLEQDWDSNGDEDGDALSEDTRFAHQISDSGHARLKRRFLDCLAEFAASKKGGKTVACSAMREAEDNVVIWIARNEGFPDVDKPTFDRIGDLLRSLSGGNAHQSDTLLWEEMVSYHRDQIEHSYIPNLRSSFKAYDTADARNKTNTAVNSSVTDATIADLRTLLFDRYSNSTGTVEKHAKLVLASYNLRRTKILEQVFYSSPSATSKSKALWLDICMLARLRVAFQSFKDIALTLPSFEHVTIMLVPRPFTPANPSQRPLNLKQTFGILKLDLSLDKIKAVLGQNSTVAKIEHEFAKRQKQKPYIHAEVQMLMFLNTNEPSTSGMIPYFGCSKLCCFMCDRFIQSYGRFTTRGCHGRLFKPWTVPSVSQLLHGRAERIAKSLIEVQQEIENELKDSVQGHKLERTSVIVGSSVFIGQREERSQRQSQITRLRMKAERNRVAEFFRRQTEDTSSSIRPTYSASVDLESDCDICLKPTKRRCNICNKGYFCSETCQERASGTHLFTCGKRPLTTADYLWKSLGRDLIPEDQDVLEDFGFNNTVHTGDRSRLFGLYRGLYLSDHCSVEDLHQWRVEGILAEKIKQFYYSIPENNRGQYFPWFLKNLNVLERPMTKDEAERKLVETFYDNARLYLDVGDRSKAVQDLKPEAKRDSYHLLAEMLRQITPNPMEPIWYGFGFVTCRGQQEESMLLDLYQLLLTESDGSFFYNFHNERRGFFQPVTFTEFWKAYEAGILIPLMDSKGLKKLRSWLPFLEGFLSVPPTGPRPSVWDLKQFLEISDPMEHPPIPSASFDYGFINCNTFEETCILMEIYGRVLRAADPLELHRACIAGHLYELSSGYVQMEERWRPLMKNVYPLKEVVESEPGDEEVSQAGPEPDHNPTGLMSLLSRLLFGNPAAGGVAN